MATPASSRSAHNNLSRAPRTRYASIYLHHLTSPAVMTRRRRGPRADAAPQPCARCRTGTGALTPPHAPYIFRTPPLPIAIHYSSRSSPCNTASFLCQPAPARHGFEEGEGVCCVVVRRDGGDGGGGADDAAAVGGAGGCGRRLRGGPSGVREPAAGAGDVPAVRAAAGDGVGADARLLRGAQDGAAEQPQVPLRAGQGPGRPKPGAQARRQQGARTPRRLQRASKHLRLPQAAEPAAGLQGRAGVRAVRQAAGGGAGRWWRQQRGELEREPAEERSGGRSRHQAVVGSGEGR